MRNVTATSTGATANVDFVIGFGISSEVLSFVSQGWIWVVDGSEPGSAEVPVDASVVDLKLQEFAFVFEDGALNSGNFAFSAENIGEQDHEIAILQIPGPLSTADLLQGLESDDESFIQGFGFLGFLAPGSTGTAALAEPLGTGNYALVCFLPDVDEVPHAFKGMVSQPSVGSPSGGLAPISPPNTGDAGLLSGSAAASFWLTSIGLMLLLTGALSGLRVLRRS